MVTLELTPEQAGTLYECCEIAQALCLSPEGLFVECEELKNLVAPIVAGTEWRHPENVENAFKIGKQLRAMASE